MRLEWDVSRRTRSNVWSIKELTDVELTVIRYALENVTADARAWKIAEKIGRAVDDLVHREVV